MKNTSKIDTGHALGAVLKQKLGIYNQDQERIYFCAIGGIGMSGIAKIMLLLGFKVYGSDIKRNSLSIELEELGAVIYYSHNKKNIPDNVKLFIISSAISNENEELLYAKKQGLNIMHRGRMLSILLSCGKSICICGSHGKTTSSSIAYHIINQLCIKHNKENREPILNGPTAIIGGMMLGHNSNAILGVDHIKPQNNGIALSTMSSSDENYNTEYPYDLNSHILIGEADESDKSFLELKPYIASITNIDLDHVENYQGLEAIKGCFLEFMMNTSGCIVVNLANQNVLKVLLKYLQKTACVASRKANIISYEFCDESPQQAVINSIPIKVRNQIKLHLMCSNLIVKQNTTRFSLKMQNPLSQNLFSFYEQNANYIKSAQDKDCYYLDLQMQGKHNVENTISAVAIALAMKFQISDIVEAVKTFQGVERRFQILGKFKEQYVIDDYAHHPEEVRAAIDTAVALCVNNVNDDVNDQIDREKNYVLAIFEPHKYTRLQYFMSDFSNSAFHSADAIIILDVYSAGEKQIINVSGEALYQNLQKRYPNKDVLYVNSNLYSDSECAQTIKTKVQNMRYARGRGAVLFMGAGRMNKIAHQFISLFKGK